MSEHDEHPPEPEEETGLGPPAQPPAPLAELVSRGAPPPLPPALGLVREPIPFTSSEQVDQIIAALAQSQLEFEALERNKRADVESKRTGVKYSYNYADLGELLNVVRPVLAGKGIAILQFPFTRARSVLITTFLAHTSGQFIRNDFNLPAPVETLDPQAIGSAITYGRRYVLQSLLGIAPEEGDRDALDAGGGRSFTPSSPPPRNGGTKTPTGPGPVQMPEREPPAAARSAPSAPAPPKASPAKSPGPAVPAEGIYVTHWEEVPRTGGKSPYYRIRFSDGQQGACFSTRLGPKFREARDAGTMFRDRKLTVKGQWTYIDFVVTWGGDKWE